MHQVISLLLIITSCYAAPREYTVYPSILDERNAAGNLILQLNDKITLNLEKSNVMADNLIFVTSTKDLHDVETVDTSYIQDSIYHDKHYQSSVVVRRKDGNVEVEGIINDNLRIRPLPEAERSMQGQMLHKIFEVQRKNENFIKAEEQVQSLRKGYKQVVARKSTNVNESSDPLQERASSRDQFLVELHIVSDKKHQNSYKSNEELITYLAVTTNAANLRYLDMANPKIKFILVGVSRVKDHEFAGNRHGVIDASAMLNGLQKYANQGKVPGHHDVVYLATGLDMEMQQDRTVAGLANFATACRSSAVGEGEDTPHTYDGVNTMAHELAHTLGSPHDETPECPWAKGYLMSYVDGGLNKFRLSPCSERKIRNYVRFQSDECIRVKSNRNYNREHRKFPGQSVRAQFLCRKLLKVTQGKKVTAKESANCKMRCCNRGSLGGPPCRTFPMLDGMQCAQGKTCKRGVCGIHTWMN
uniref:Putative tick salivary metalloprotease n=1 Tax=Rhipicephalus pulchellus TaxID=72859 RepID=L7LQM2_RHIPC